MNKNIERLSRDTVTYEIGVTNITFFSKYKCFIKKIKI